jgi:hypothetical protein
VSDLLTPPAPVRPRAQGTEIGNLPSSPPARRAQRPRWRDTRLLFGVLLMVVSVVIGARFVSGATRTTQWLSVTRALPAGHVLTASDLAPVKAHLAAAAGSQYFTSEPLRLVGRTLIRPLAAGELLPSEALASGPAAASRVVPILVKAGRLPALAAGDHIDVYVLARSTGSGAGREVRVLTDVEFISQEIVGTGGASIQLRVTPKDAIGAVAASQSDRVDVVRVDRDASADPGESGPSSAPAYSGG